MSVFMQLYIHSPWSLDTADHTILLTTAHIHNHFCLLHPPMVPNSQLGGLESPARAKPPARNDIGSHRKWPVATLAFELRVAGLHVTCSPESGTSTTQPSRLGILAGVQYICIHKFFASTSTIK